MKKVISIFLAVMIIVSGFPVADIVAFAAEGEPVFTSIIVNKVFRDLFGVEKYSIIINGNNFTVDGRNIVEVGIMGGDGTVKAFTPIYSSKTMLQYELKPSELTGNLFIDGKQIDISEQDMPSITNKTPTTGIVDSASNAEITLIGSGFNKLSGDLKAYLFQGNSKLSTFTKIDDSTIQSTELKGKTGVWSVEFEKKGKVDNLKKENGDNADLTISHRYMDMFSVLNRLDVSEKIDLIPTQGPVESIVMLQADNLKPANEMSIFFLKNLDDPYLATHMGINENYRRDLNLQKDIFSFTVPKDLTPGSYYVVLTNEVDPKKDIKSQIKSYKILDSKFTVIDRKNMVLIDSIDPNKGSSKGVDAVIKGINIARISPDIYEGGNRVDIDNTNTNKMIVKYTGGTYKMIGENGVTVSNLTREIKFIVGGEVTFREGSKLDEAVYDYINVRVGENLDQQNLVKDVIVEIKTIIEYEENGDTKKSEVFETYTLKDGFTYEALDYVPRITSIVPDKIPVDNNFEAMEGLKVSILGEKFLLYRYKDGEGNIKYKYPKFDFGGQFSIDPNTEDIQMRILDRQGNEIDGTEGNDLGNKILLTIPSGKKVKEDVLNSQLDLKITNPIRVPDSEDEGSSATYKIVFIKPEGDKTPFITSVTPSTITTSGEKGVLITGQNFSQNFTLYMDGERIASANRNGTGTEITFDAPPNPEGYVQLIVQNDDGALAFYDKFLYVKTYTDPKIKDFNPKRGTANTLVDLKGENLVPPNPFVRDLDGIGFMKLIGTRIFIGGKDINTYTTDNKLKEYETPEDNKILQAEGNKLKLSDYYHSIILEDDNGIYYKIYFDTISGKTLLTDGDKDIYTITAKEGKVLAKKGGDPDEEVVVDTKEIKVYGKTLKIKTPYATEIKDGKNIITGNRVKVLNNNELYFTVPILPRDGYYDVEIVNPDEKRDARRGTAGFNYYSDPTDLPPKIEKIDPSEGSVDGQYDITITGENFVDRGGDKKTSVTIGGVVVPPQDITVSPDGKSMTVKVPKYPGDLSKETDMDRKYVNVVVQNPEGGPSDRRINGFAYVIPTSNPKIDNIFENKGSAVGGYIVTIEGSGFRYFEPFKDSNNNGIWDEGETFTEENDKNKNGKWDDLRRGIPEDLKAEWDKLVVPILPTVYFGDKIAKIKSFTESTIDVEVPKGIKGPVQVYIVNNDRGISNKFTFTYEASSPKINSIRPTSGRKKGGDKPEIFGEGFAESSVLIYDNLSSLPKERNLVQLQFANLNDNNMTNANLPLDNLDSGRVRDRIAQAKAGQLELRYDATGDGPKLSLTLTDNSKKYTGTNIPYNDQEVFIPLNLLVNDKGERYEGNEMVRIRRELIQGANNTYRIRIDRGFSPSTELENPRQIIVVTPSYYTIGEVQVQLINPDGGIATTKYTYTNPDSKPQIKNITKDGQEPQLGKIDNRDMKVHQISYRGGNELTIIGEDFRENATILIGDIMTFTPNQIKYELSDNYNEDRLTVTIPALNENLVGDKLHRVVVVNEDGASAASDSLEPPIYIQIIKGESAPTIESITPNSGPVKGGTEVIIKGKDFRKTMEGYEGKELAVYFGEVKAEVKEVAYNTIKVISPPNIPGKVAVKVVNPDGELAQPVGTFTYLSSPTISSVVDPSDTKETTRISTISVEGGEVIKLKGSSFSVGARVVFAPSIRKALDNEIDSGNAINIGGEWYIIESGVDGTEVNVIDSETLTVKTPQSKEGTKGVIVINPDKGASDIYQDLEYGLPQLKPPTKVEAELVYDRYIKVHWTPVSGAKSYEIYVVINDRQKEFIGNTDLTSFVYQDLEPRTRYQFIVKTIGDYGSSLGSDESNIVRTGRVVGPPDTDSGITEKTTTTKSGDTVNIIIGTKDYDKKDTTIDLTKTEYAGTNKIVITIPAKIIAARDSKNINIIGTDYNMSFKPDVFGHSNVIANRDKDDAGVRFTIENNKGDTKTGSQASLSNQYLLYADFFIGKNSSKIDNLASYIDFTLDYDHAKADLRKAKEVYLGRYNEYNESWESTISEVRGFNSSIRATINKLGRYTVFGKRG
ncbi:hypothetical protein DW1_0175 [Proteiniborus sp. DW1]|uniref:IPT/TIG domain-containing protein n=1 Tax=Proteiniborus sp. DW1 TaxID=1889883 RepID=UPI00092E16CF|nr:IPT/TIG domain-containing protein [Proteiniborus sp. DW1]SCG81796.1 hypothetical protein DW1_0175 [Proteiniborus sp. DW1]